MQSQIVSEISDIIKESINKFNLEVSCSKSCSCKLCKNVDDSNNDTQNDIVRSASSRIIDLMNNSQNDSSDQRSNKSVSHSDMSKGLSETNFESVINSILNAFTVVKCKGDYNGCESYYDDVVFWFEQYKEGKATLYDCPYLPDGYIEGYDNYGTIGNPSNKPIRYLTDDSD